MALRSPGFGPRFFAAGLVLVVVATFALNGQARVISLQLPALDVAVAADGARTDSSEIWSANPTTSRGAAQTLSALPDLREYDWTHWLVGEWEGWIENAEGDRTPLQQSFEYAADGRHILTRLRVGSEQDPAYFGVGIFSYDPRRGLSTGDWYGMLGDRNYALGRRDGEAWTWDIYRHGRERVLRVRQRLNEHEYQVTSTTITADGDKRVSRERMKRIRAKVE